MDNRSYEVGAYPTPPAAPAVPSAGYPTNGDPLGSVNPTLPGAFWFHQIGEELRAVLTAAGITPSTANNAQLLEAIQRLIDAQSGNYALDTGAANAYVVALSPAITAYVDGMTVRVKAVNANLGASTLNAGGGAVSLVNDVGGALVQGDVPAGGIFAATYVASANKFYITSLVPSQALSQVQGDARYGSSFIGVGATVGANALAATLNPCKLDFRSATLSTGTPNNRTVPSAISLVIPSGATLGTVSGQAARLVLLAIDNAGTVEMAVVNLAGGLNLDETTLISTTTISAAATSASVIYSTTARTSVPFRVVGFIDITEAAAGTWATAPTTVQGVGGQALAALSSLGYGQTWQTVTRASGTTYYNTTGKPIRIALLCSSAAATCSDSLTINGVVVGLVGTAAANGNNWQLNGIVPPGGSYSHTAVSMTVSAIELR